MSYLRQRNRWPRRFIFQNTNLTLQGQAGNWYGHLRGTFVLDDGREVRLAAIEVPTHGGSSGPAAPPITAAAALDALAAGDEVVLRRAETGSDRYGRLLAYAYIVRDGDQFLLQQELIGDGFARVGARIASTCSGDLLNREKAARAGQAWPMGRSVLWGAQRRDSGRCAGAPRPICAGRGQSGVRPRESGATIYVNFGRRRSGDITVTVLKRNERSFTAAGLDLKALAGRRIRVRAGSSNAARTAPGSRPSAQSRSSSGTKDRRPACAARFRDRACDFWLGVKW